MQDVSKSPCIDALQCGIDDQKSAIEYIKSDSQIIAIIIRASFREPGIHFFTPSEFSQQIAFMWHPTGKTIAPHVHNPQPKHIQLTQEVLLIRKGCVRVDFYDDDRCYLHSRILRDGDMILLAAGGHGFEILAETEMFEVKQGPYSGDADKTRFIGIQSEEVIVHGG
jgi:hypothetical protein